MTNSHYQLPTPSLWVGRDDEPKARFFQHIQFLDLRKLPASLPGKSFVLLGFACDEGVKRNFGRPGAKQGPENLRKALANLPLSFNEPTSLWDAGTIFCNDDDLEKAQLYLGKAVAALRERGAFVIVLGGGHEVAWGNFQGLMKQEPIDTLNFDAHFDLRPLLPENKGSSGTSFSQIYNACEQEKIPWRYACFGLQPFGNTKQLFETAKKINTTYCLAETMIHCPEQAHKSLDTWLAAAQQIHLTLCLDVFFAAHAPGVSAPQVFGIAPQQLLPFFRQALKSGKVIGFDIAELNPTYDRDEQTAKLAAHFVMELLSIFQLCSHQ